MLKRLCNWIFNLFWSFLRPEPPFVLTVRKTIIEEHEGLLKKKGFFHHMKSILRLEKPLDYEQEL